MSSFAGKYLVALGLLTALQILPSQPSPASLQSSDSTRTTQKATAAAAIEMLTDAEGVDFEPFLQSVYRSVKREWLSAMAPSIQKGG